MKNTFALIALMFLIFFSACKKTEEKTVDCITANGSVTPTLSFVSMSDSVIQFSGGSHSAINTIFLTFSDADGDLIDYSAQCNTNCTGPLFFPVENSEDSCLLLDRCRHLFTVDNRDSVLNVYSFQPLGMIDPSLTIFNDCRYQDTLCLRITCYSKKCFVPSGPECIDTIRLRIFVRDQANHFSNIIDIPPIVVVPE